MSKYDNHLSYKAQCPFYKGDVRNIIHCEGISDGTAIHLAFRGSTQKYMDQHCRDRWLECPIAKMLWDIND